MNPVSMSRLAALANVSKMTVSLALRNSPRVSPTQRRKIREIADRLGYQPDPERAHLMARIRSKAGRSYQGNIAFVSHPLTDFFYGKQLKERIHAQSTQCGFVCNDFLLNHGDLCKNLVRVLKSRGIQGVVLCTTWGVNLDQSFRPLFEQFACVVVGSIPKIPGLHAADVDHYRAIRLAFGQALLKGYQRPGLIAEWETEIRREYRSSAAFLAEQHALAPENRIPILWDIASESRRFSRWFEANRPDCILCDGKSLSHLQEKQYLEIPRKIGVISLDWQKEHSYCAGVDLRYEIAGSAAIELLVQNLNMDEVGIPEHPKIVLIQPKWQPGLSLAQLPVPNLLSTQEPESDHALPGRHGKGQRFVSVALSNFANKSREKFNTNHDRSQILGLIHFPSGKRFIQNVPYEIIDEVDNGGKSLVSLHEMPDHTVKATPLSVTVPLQQRCRAVWFLHGCVWAKAMKHASSYRFNYADGSALTVPIITLDEADPETTHRRLGMKANIQDWWYTKQLVKTEEAKPVLVQNPEDPDLYLRQLYTLHWINPYPHLEIKSLTLSGQGQGPTSVVVLAVTLEVI